MKTVTKITAVNSKKSKLRVAAYARVSTSSDEQLDSLENQKSYFENYINAHPDWELADIYFDSGITGTKLEVRPQLLRLIKDCEDGKIDYIIVKSISRFARNTTDCLEIVRKLQGLNIPIYFEKENINTCNMESELLLGILSSLAENESVSISQNTKWAIKKRFENGTFKISYPPYGYKNINGKMVISPEQAEIVKQIFAEYLSGLSCEKIAENLNRIGISSPKNSRWTATTIRGILTNEKYIGDAIFQKTFTDEHFNRHKNTGEKDMFYVQNHHEPIISKADFNAVKSMLSEHSKAKNIKKNSMKYCNRYAFSGKIFCGECGSKFKRRTHTNCIAWCCENHIKSKDNCSMKFIRDKDIKNAFISMFNSLILDNSELKSALKNPKNSGNNISDLQAELRQIFEQKNTLQNLLAKGFIDQIIFTEQTNELNSKACKIKCEIDILSRKDERILELKSLLEFTEKSEIFDNFNDEIFVRFVDKIVVVSRDILEFNLKCGLVREEKV